ncbi:MAG: hypothetical protein G01um101420_46 [Parcubacteria group bacterium Gr01-1014_20]|nr:MAG: hypothetical protein G01um101420_46 [Parcubacteria group bacterium Gr01-1014_20]
MIRKEFAQYITEAVGQGTSQEKVEEKLKSLGLSSAELQEARVFYKKVADEGKKIDRAFNASPLAKGPVMDFQASFFRMRLVDRVLIYISVFLFLLVIGTSFFGLFQYEERVNLNRKLLAFENEKAALIKHASSRFDSLSSKVKDYFSISGVDCGKEVELCLNDILDRVKVESSLIKATLSSPYLVSWSEAGSTFSLSGVSLGPTVAGPDLSDGRGGLYREGVTLNALVLHLKITSGKTAECLSVDFRRVLDEEGNLAQPNTFRYKFVDPSIPGSFTGCPMSSTTYNDQSVIFVVGKDEKEFLLNTGGQSNLFFTVKVVEGNKLKVEKPIKKG